MLLCKASQNLYDSMVNQCGVENVIIYAKKLITDTENFRTFKRSHCRVKKCLLFSKAFCGILGMTMTVSFDSESLGCHALRYEIKI